MEIAIMGTLMLFLLPVVMVFWTFLVAMVCVIYDYKTGHKRKPFRIFGNDN